MSLQHMAASTDQARKPCPGPGATTSREQAEYLLLHEVSEGAPSDGAALVAQRLRASLAGPGGDAAWARRFGPRSGRPIRRPISGADVSEVDRVVISSRTLSAIWRQVRPAGSDQ